jgi:hypothetical protein
MPTGAKRSSHDPDRIVVFRRWRKDGRHDTRKQYEFRAQADIGAPDRAGSRYIPLGLHGWLESKSGDEVEAHLVRIGVTG